MTILGLKGTDQFLIVQLVKSGSQAEFVFYATNHATVAVVFFVDDFMFHGHAF
jgi:hypothetical protein